MESDYIFLVEDNPDDEALLLRALQKNQIGVKVRVARDGVEALDFLFGLSADAEGEAGHLPLAVLLDLKLPRLDGLEVLRRVRNHHQTRHLPVIMMTSSDEERDLMESRRLGADRYVCKSADFSSFAAVVRQIGIDWLNYSPVPDACQDVAGDE